MKKIIILFGVVFLVSCAASKSSINMPSQSRSSKDRVASIEIPQMNMLWRWFDWLDSVSVKEDASSSINKDLRDKKFSCYLNPYNGTPGKTRKKTANWKI